MYTHTHTHTKVVLVYVRVTNIYYINTDSLSIINVRRQNEIPLLGVPILSDGKLSVVTTTERFILSVTQRRSHI